MKGPEWDFDPPTVPSECCGADVQIEVLDTTTNAIQLPVYGVSAEQQLSGHRGRQWRLGTAGYVAFGDNRTFVPVGRDDKAVEEAVREGQERLVKAIEGIEGGRFPVQPAEPFRCRFCAYPSVCRMDYVGDE